jgi:predicted O-methyltransferase YrrM
VLADVSRAASSIIEFGSGASTQIFAQMSPKRAEIISVETNGGWIERTRAILETIGCRDRVRFTDYQTWSSEIIQHPPPAYDIAFDDGIDPLRADFARLAWRRLKIGGKLLFHDTRRSADALNLMQCCLNNFLEVQSIELNIRSSNVNIVTKKMPEPYQDWNVCEGRSPLMIGRGSLDESIAHIKDHFLKL